MSHPLSPRLKRDYTVAEPRNAIPLFSAAPKPTKAIGSPHVSVAQDYTRSINERSYEHHFDARVEHVGVHEPSGWRPGSAVPCK